MNEKRICGCPDDTPEVKRRLLKNLERNHKKDNYDIYSRLNTIHIGIVFHICYTDKPSNKVEQDINHSIKMLNNDFNRTPDNFNRGLGVYDDIHFNNVYTAYAKRAESAHINFYRVITKYGIVENQTTSNISTLNKFIKSKSPAINPEQYLNVWVVDMNGGIFGYSQYPWDLQKSSETDGVVIAHGTFGKNPSYKKFNLNKNLTHQVGHWLGLYHTFNDDINLLMYANDRNKRLEGYRDCVIDIQPQQYPTYGNPFKDKTFPLTSGSNVSNEQDVCKSYHMFMNYMDFTDDEAQFMFTRYQVYKMRQMIQIYRPTIFENNPHKCCKIPNMNNEVNLIDFDTDFDNVEKKDIIQCSFDRESNNNIQYIHNSVGNPTVELTGKYLKTRNRGRCELEVDLSGMENPILCLRVKARNLKTAVWIKPRAQESDNSWYKFNIPFSCNFEQNFIKLPTFGHNNIYKIRIGTDSYHKIFSYFDTPSIIDAKNISNQFKKEKKGMISMDDFEDF
jgi:hypothetical protein